MILYYTLYYTKSTSFVRQQQIILNLYYYACVQTIVHLLPKNWLQSTDGSALTHAARADPSVDCNQFFVYYIYTLAMDPPPLVTPLPI